MVRWLNFLRSHEKQRSLSLRSISINAYFTSTEFHRTIFTRDIFKDTPPFFYPPKLLHDRRVVKRTEISVQRGVSCETAAQPPERLH